MSSFDARARGLGRALTRRTGAAWRRTKQLFAKMTSTRPGRHA